MTGFISHCLATEIMMDKLRDNIHQKNTKSCKKEQKIKEFIVNELNDCSFLSVV